MIRVRLNRDVDTTRFRKNLDSVFGVITGLLEGGDMELGDKEIPEVEMVLKVLNHIDGFHAPRNGNPTVTDVAVYYHPIQSRKSPVFAPRGGSNGKSE